MEKSEVMGIGIGYTNFVVVEEQQNPLAPRERII